MDLRDLSICDLEALQAQLKAEESEAQTEAEQMDLARQITLVENEIHNRT
jgi:hypothetical protein